MDEIKKLFKLKIQSNLSQIIYNAPNHLPKKLN